MVAGLTLTVTEGSSTIVEDEDAVASAILVAATVTVCAVAMVAGAAYMPDALIDPIPIGLIDHVTDLLAVLVTVAVSCAVWPLSSAVIAGLTLTAMGGAVPLKVTDCVDGDALSVIVMAEVKDPAVTGVK